VSENCRADAAGSAGNPELKQRIQKVLTVDGDTLDMNFERYDERSILLFTQEAAVVKDRLAAIHKYR
jgi:hypothetical protein